MGKLRQRSEAGRNLIRGRQVRNLVMIWMKARESLMPTTKCLLKTTDGTVSLKGRGEVEEVALAR